MQSSIHIQSPSLSPSVQVEREGTKRNIQDPLPNQQWFNQDIVAENADSGLESQSDSNSVSETQRKRNPGWFSSNNQPTKNKRQREEETEPKRLAQSFNERWKTISNKIEKLESMFGVAVFCVVTTPWSSKVRFAGCDNSLLRQMCWDDPRVKRLRGTIMDEITNGTGRVDLAERVELKKPGTRIELVDELFKILGKKRPGFKDAALRPEWYPADLWEKFPSRMTKKELRSILQSYYNYQHKNGNAIPPRISSMTENEFQHSMAMDNQLYTQYSTSLGPSIMHYNPSNSNLSLNQHYLVNPSHMNHMILSHGPSGNDPHSLSSLGLNLPPSSSYIQTPSLLHPMHNHSMIHRQNMQTVHGQAMSQNSQSDEETERKKDDGSKRPANEEHLEKLMFKCKYCDKQPYANRTIFQNHLVRCHLQEITQNNTQSLPLQAHGTIMSMPAHEDHLGIMSGIHVSHSSDILGIQDNSNQIIHSIHTNYNSDLGHRSL